MSSRPRHDILVATPMTTRVFYANGGNDRLVVSTIRVRLVFFHEAGVAVSSERKVAVRPVWWRPATWRGFRWQRCAEAEQARNLSCLFNGGTDPAALGATAETSPGYIKLACDSLAVRRHCVWVAQGGGTPTGDAAAVDRRASDVRDVTVHFDYGGAAHTVRHAAAPRDSHGEKYCHPDRSRAPRVPRDEVRAAPSGRLRSG